MGLRNFSQNASIYAVQITKYSYENKFSTAILSFALRKSNQRFDFLKIALPEHVYFDSKMATYGNSKLQILRMYEQNCSVSTR